MISISQLTIGEEDILFSGVHLSPKHW